LRQGKRQRQLLRSPDDREKDDTRQGADRYRQGHPERLAGLVCAVPTNHSTIIRPDACATAKTRRPGG
jgi:hypothetical protein